MKRGRKPRVFNEDEIEILYTKRNLSSHQIARMINAHHGQVLNVLEKRGVKRKTRSESLRVFYEKRFSSLEM